MKPLKGTSAPESVSVLFVLENDYYPRDMRVYNECSSLSRLYSCYVLAPRQKGERFCDAVGSVRCFRYPHFEARSLKGLPVEYANAAFWIALLVPLIVFVKGVKVIHVANPPDFIIPVVGWLKLFRRKLIYDLHDLSLATFEAKTSGLPLLRKSVVPLLKALERASLFLADAIITTNTSIHDYAEREGRGKRTYIVRNSNPVMFLDTEEVHKSRAGRTAALHIGYFGVLADDDAAGLDNFLLVANALARKGAEFKFSIVGSGPGLSRLKRKIADRDLEKRFDFAGFVPMPDAFALLKDFDFGLVTWGDLPKNHLHTAMKVMDYMCCAVPVCSLPLKEQLNSTQRIGIHADTFEEIADRMVELHNKPDEYEALRRRSLDHFNKVLSWQLQEKGLLMAYTDLTST